MRSMTSVKAVVVTDTCPYCEVVKKTLEQEGLLDKVKIINASTKEGFDFARKHGILAVPECVIIGEDGNVRSCSEGEFKQMLKKEEK